jgi:hypothetical protein
MKPLLLTEQTPDRRGFLRRLDAATGAATATHTLLLPAQALITPADAAARLAHHLAGAEAAFADLYPHGEILQWGNHQGGKDTDLRGRFARGELSGALVLHFRTIPAPPVPDQLREVAEKLERRLELR